MTITSMRGRLAAADNSQRMILRCAMTDACRWYELAQEACPACVTARGLGQDSCTRHQDDEARFSEHCRLSLNLDYDTDHGHDDACDLTAADRAVITHALGLAIRLRQDRAAAEDAALTAAYRELARQLAG
ncbi:MAG: hypothetical protein ACLP52_08580 [Streptosporangiaceae bacterium]